MARTLPIVVVSSFALVLGCTTSGSLRYVEYVEPVESNESVDSLERPNDAVADHRAHPAQPPPADGMYAYTSPGELPQLIVLDGKGRASNLPLKHTDVDARVVGHVAQVRVAQEFRNDRAEPIEVTYTFPLPENSAVDSMRMVIGERVIEGVIQRRAEARSTYEQARAAGHTSALLEQERPNIFTQSVANVPPGETITVEVTYLQTLSQDAGTYEFVFPMVVGPRFIPPGDAVPDAARIMPPVLGTGVRTGHDVSLALEVAIGSSIARWDAPTHTVAGKSTNEGFAIHLADAETIPNRDFVVRWSAASTSTQARLLLGEPDAKGRGHFALIVQPPAVDLDALVGQREMIFVIDRSGSMSGLPLALAKQTLREALRRLRPVDTFDVIGFESGTERLFGAPRPANQDNLVLAERFIDGLEAGGGTMMAGAVEAALAPKLSAGRHRYVFFLTDGYIGNETEIFTGARSLIGRAEHDGLRARVFGIGIGSAPNRELIAGLSEAGEGVPLYVGNREHPHAAVESWSRYVDHAVLEDLEVDWGGLTVSGRYPTEVPDLFASHAVVMLGRYAGDVRSDVELTATLSDGGQIGQTITIPITVGTSDVDDRILATLWAREKIASITAAGWDGALDRSEVERSITEVGLDFGLVTAFTSFVAVDRSRVVGKGDPTLVNQPVEVPEDVDPAAAGSVVVSTVGSSTARDFTAVVDMAPTASRDAAGLWLAGTTGAESKYVVHSANVMRTSTDSPTPITKLSLARIDVTEGVDVRELRRAIIQRSMMFEACYEQKVRSIGKAAITLRLRFDASGKLVKIEISSGTLGNESADECVQAVLRKLDWRGLPATRSMVDIELGLRMR